MIIGVPKEIKAQENRVAITPAGGDSLVKAGHKVYIESKAGAGSGFPDEEYRGAGAEILGGPEEVFAAAEMIVKVKEPLPAEYGLLKENQILFTYLHLAPDPEQTQALLKQKVIGIAYETVQLPDRSLPLLSPMSEVAGRMAVQVGARLLEKTNEGRGILLGGVPGVEPAQVVVLGGGNVGLNAIKMAVGPGNGIGGERPAAGLYRRVVQRPGSDADEQRLQHSQSGKGGGPGHRGGADPGSQDAEAGNRGNGQEHAAGIGAGGRGH